MTNTEFLEPIEIQTGESDDEEGTTSYLFDISPYFSRNSICVGIAAALAGRLQRSELRIPPLESVIDCDAIESLLRPRRVDTSQHPISVTFPYDIYTVTVSTDERVLIQN